jgi:carbon storage regulator
VGQGRPFYKDVEMLVITRKKDEEFLIGKDVVVKVTYLDSGRVKLGITAPKEVRVVRKELDDRDREAQCEPANK